jgi:hypothetical protein
MRFVVYPDPLPLIESSIKLGHGRLCFVFMLHSTSQVDRLLLGGGSA